MMMWGLDHNDKPVINNWMAVNSGPTTRYRCPGAAYKQWVEGLLFQHNRLAKGRYGCAGAASDLSASKVPLLNIAERSPRLFLPQAEAAMPCGRRG